MVHLLCSKVKNNKWFEMVVIRHFELRVDIIIPGLGETSLYSIGIKRIDLVYFPEEVFD